MFFQFFNSNIGYVCMCYLRPYHPVVIAVIDVLCLDKGHAKQVDAAYAKECALEGMAKTQVMWLKEGIIKA